MATDLYNALGLSNAATDAEIKSAYRKLAKKYHPDLNKNDSKVAEKFQKVKTAYEILSNKEKRSQYDQGLINEKGEPNGPQMGGFGSDFSDIFRQSGSRRQQSRGFGGQSSGFGFEDLFSNFFKQGAGSGQSQYDPYEQETPSEKKKASKNYVLTIGFIEAALGAERSFTLAQQETVKLKIPAGAKTGDKLRLKGKGEADIYGRRGDAIVELEVANHPHFVREGLHILVNVPITIYEAVLGEKITVPTLKGLIKVTVPPMSQSGQTLRLKGKGIVKGKVAGDLLLKLMIKLPEKPESKFQEGIKLLKEAPYTVRKFT